MANTKEYKIVINGLTESIDAVKSLNKQLDSLEQRMNKINSSKVSGGGASSAKDEEATEREINKLKKEGAALDAKRMAAQDAEYQKVLAMKDLYKETIQDQKAIAAQERLTADAYSNTMAGMKAQLADLKAVINTTDLGDSDKIKQMTQEANQLSEKLKQMEQAYGQFGRNVGNYASAAEGFSKYKIEVGGVVREFETAKEAAKTLSNELLNLPKGAKGAKELREALQQVKSEIKDINKSSAVMDNLLDTMESFTAIASVGKGMSAMFGIDDDEIQKSIQKLVALQNVMQGIEKINQQINTQEGIGGWLARGNAMIDSFVAKITGANKAQEALNASTTAGATASKSLAAAQEAQAVATGGATVATKALSFALKTLGIGLVIAAVAALIEYWEDIYDWFIETIPALKNLNTWFDKIKAVVVGVGTAIINYMVQPLATLAKVIQAVINGNFSEIPNIITDGLKKTYNIAGNFQKGYNKETERQQKAHNSKMLKEQKEANEEWLKDEEAKNGRSLSLTKEYVNKQMGLIDQQLANEKKGSEKYNELQKERNNLQRQLWSAEREEREKHQKKSLSDAKKYSKEESEVTKTLYDLEMKLMKDGLVKKLRQLDEEERQTLNKLKDNSRVTADELRKIQQMYYQLRIKEMEEYLRTIEEKIKDSADNIKSIQFTLDINEIENKINSLKNKMEGLAKDNITENTFSALTSARDAKRLASDPNSVYSGMPLLPDERILTNAFHNRYEQTKLFYTNLLNELIKFTKEESKLNEERLRKQEEQERYAENKRWHMQQEELSEQKFNLKQQIANLEIKNEEDAELLEEWQENLEKVENQIIVSTEQHNTKMLQISEATNNAIRKNELDTQKDISSIQEKYYNLQISNFRDLQSKINTEMQRQPVTDLIGFGIVNLSQSKKNYDEIKNAAIEALDKIKDARKSLNKDYDDGLISLEAVEATEKSFNDMEQSLRQTLEDVGRDSKNLTGKFIASIGKYVNAVGQTLEGIMSAVWDYQDYQFDKEQEELDKYNDKLEEALDKQEDIISEHNDKINSIEDELATSRGDRRQHLIDQLNAEIAAQREAEKERQRIQKEQERAQKRQDALDKKRKEAEYDRNLQSILVSGAMAITNAFATQPFVPVGIAMGALATTLTAVQYALAKQQKPFRYGGQLEGGLVHGKRHTQGGVPVGNTGIEVEGDEMIIRRESTIPNIDLLGYINNSKRKLDLDDFIEFYSSGKVKNTITSMSPRGKFAQGGLLPTISNEYKFDDRLLESFEKYAERPYYVTVTDIENRMNQVKYVRTLAGLEQE